MFIIKKTFGSGIFPNQVIKTEFKPLLFFNTMITKQGIKSSISWTEKILINRGIDMTLIRWNPWQEFNTIQRKINHLFDEDTLPTAFWDRGLSRVPAAELKETEDAIHLKLELPGIEAKDLDLQVTENAVYLSGERKSETKSEEKGVIKSEFHYGKFQRVIPLPARIQNTNVTADYKDGILNLTLPKAEEEKNKVVKVNLASSG